ncbi:hypothetical protein OIU76_013793 [Salix suchowensis]|nr:hypothetical protein OIU76_013793 [Salix suchowensis]
MASPPAPSPTSRPCYRSLPHLKAGKGGSGAKVHDCELINTELSTMLFIPVIVNVVVMGFWIGLVSGLRLALDML